MRIIRTLDTGAGSCVVVLTIHGDVLLSKQNLNHHYKTQQPNGGKVYSAKTDSVIRSYPSIISAGERRQESR